MAVDVGQLKSRPRPTAHSDETCDQLNDYTSHADVWILSNYSAYEGPAMPGFCGRVLGSITELRVRRGGQQNHSTDLGNRARGGSGYATDVRIREKEPERPRRSSANTLDRGPRKTPHRLRW